MQTCDSETGIMTLSLTNRCFLLFICRIWSWEHCLGTSRVPKRFRHLLHAWIGKSIELYLLHKSEYLAITGDFEFLNEQVDFYPKDSKYLPPGAKGCIKGALSHTLKVEQYLIT